MAFMAAIMVFGLLFYILLGFRCRFVLEVATLRTFPCRQVRKRPLARCVSSKLKQRNSNAGVEWPIIAKTLNPYDS